MTKKTEKPAEIEPVVKALHVAMGFATFAIMAIFLVKPASDFVANTFVKNQTVQPIASKKIDMTITGSITPPTSGTSTTKRQDRLYTVRRSVLQKSHENSCVIANDGSRSGDC